MTKEAQAPMRDETFDVIIIGAGINGAGVFRDLCEQGLRCLIVDKGDFGAGTSAAPSRLIHGGLKYLETAELRLVAESTHERNRLLRNAPHVVHPLPSLLPAFSWLRGTRAALRTLFGATNAPRSRGALLVKIGLSLYDFYGARDRVMPRHRLFSRRTARQMIPALTRRVSAAGLYYDAVVTAPERMVFELIEDGLAAQPASMACNWTPLRSCDGARLVFDRPDGTTLEARGRTVINAAGPWIDAVNARLGEPTRLIGGAKGSHILLDHDELLRQLDGRMIYFEADDGRICLVFPYNGRALVGSTDQPAADPDNVRCDDDEVEYFLDSLRKLLPGLTFSRDQILYRYSGIRPLPNSDSDDPGLISRDHSMPRLPASGDRPFSVLSLVGGKWTTFRAFAEQVSDHVLEELGAARRRHTRDLAIGGGHAFPADANARTTWLNALESDTGLTGSRLNILLERYGTRAAVIAAHEATSSTVTIDGARTHTEAEIDWLARNERIEHLEDIVLRRTLLAITGQLTRAGLVQMARVTAAACGWDEQRTRAEVDQTLDGLRRRHSVEL